MNSRKRKIIFITCCVLTLGLFQCLYARAAQADDAVTPSEGVTTDGTPAGDMLEGNASDISVSGVKVSGNKAGGKVTIQFTVTGNKNSKKHYEADSVSRVYPVLNDTFPFSMDDEAYKVINGTGNTANCSYTFKAKDNLDTGYYMTGFTVVYTRKSIDGKTKDYDSEYYVTKNMNVKLNATKPKATATPEITPDTSSLDEDVSLQMKGTPYGSYGSSCSVAFTAKSSKYNITSVVPVVDSNFPFESNTDAYKVYRSHGTKSLSCKYNFQVKDNVTSGYQGVTFKITYKKNGTTVTASKTVNVELKGKKNENKSKDGKKSTPRVMVAGYTTDVKKVLPNEKFTLTIQIKNNAPKAVQNVKFTLSTANGEFLPVSGASTAYVDSIPAKGMVNLVFKMKANANLGAKSYPITVKAEYEDAKADSYNSQDNVSIPVTLKDRIKLSDVTPPDMLAVDGTGDLTFSLNNMGVGSLNNVTVSCKGKDFSCEESYVGNIAAGATGYADVVLTGTSATPDDSDGECTIVIKYENASGESKVYKEKTNIYVSSEDYSDAGADGDMMDEDAGTQKKMPVIPIVIGVVVVVIVIIVVVRIVRKKRRLKKEEELMDDELL